MNPTPTPADITAEAAPPSARAEATRARIEETAERLFRTMGYQKTAVADIARELGMSPANVYRFFASKSAINEAIAQRLLGAISTELSAIARGPGAASARLRLLMSTVFERQSTVFFAERRMHDMVAAAMEEHWGVCERYIDFIEATIRQVIEDGMNSGEFARTDPALAAENVMHAFIKWTHPVLVESCILRKGETVEMLRAQIAAMTDFVLGALRA
ncbi:MAG: TetR family transcriptional regulator [Alphaproteobacteria bacterium]|nr:TetR family transcriptional regulator [Alphaproteobacteria bacterium]